MMQIWEKGTIYEKRNKKEEISMVMKKGWRSGKTNANVNKQGVEQGA